MKGGGWIVAAVLVCSAGRAHGCGFARISEVHDVTATCCEVLGDDDCSAGFPATCASTCADVLVPFWEECGTFIQGLSSASFNFDIPSFGTFAGVCRNARSLVHFANGVCSNGATSLQARVDDIQQSCCVQEGQNVCLDGVPWTCNALCAVPFMTFFSSCIEPGVMGVDDLTAYRTLYESCQNLDPTQKAILMSDLESLVEDETCQVDTSAITSATAADGGLPNSATEECLDDDDELQKVFGDGFTCISARASAMCGLVTANAPLACTCSCPPDGTGPVCHNDDAGLAATFGDPSFTCTSAATTGMCALVEANAPGMCGCSCDDDGHRRNLGEMLCTPLEGVATVTGRADDSEENVADGTVALDSSDLELMHDGGGMQVVAIRFPSVDLAPRTTVGTASILFDVDEVRPGQSDQKVSITIFGEASANPGPLSAGSYDLSNRNTTSAAEMWTPTASSTTHEDLVTSDISSIMNEIVRLPGWVSGNPMVILFGHVSGRGVRWVESARENNRIMTPALRWTTICGSGMDSSDAVIDTMDGPPEFLPLTNVYFSPACPLDSIDNAIYAISSSCCTELTPCNATNQGVPAECTFDCNRVFAPFMANCRETISALVGHRDANAGAPADHSTMNSLDHYTQICSQFSVASMSAAIYASRCGVCGDESVDEWLEEECDAGVANANTPDAPCRPDCQLPRCGDGVQDSAEGCDEGDANSADGSCGSDCQPTWSCPPEGLQFTTLGASGRNGPTSTAGYADTALDGVVTLDGGIQQWTVPRSGGYRIEAIGAGNSCGGSGAAMAGLFELTQGEVLSILVGQQGSCSGDCGGGSGGTFVARGQEPLIVAGGTGAQNSGGAGTGEAGGAALVSGGTGGSGGSTGNGDGGCAGAGFSGDGSGSGWSSNCVADPAQSFLHGGQGGQMTGQQSGGFGGGGGGHGSCEAGGGGGYSGGSGAGAGHGGAGGSYNAGSEQQNEASANPGQGRATIMCMLQNGGRRRLSEGYGGRAELLPGDTHLLEMVNASL